MMNLHTSYSIAPSFAFSLSPKKLVLKLLATLISMDQAYKDKCHIARLSDEARNDAGLTR